MPATSGASTAAVPAGPRSHDTTDSPAGPPGAHRRSGPPLLWCRRHALFLVVLLVGIAWRVLAQLSFSPAFISSESGSQLTSVGARAHSAAFPAGYGVLELAPLSWFTDALTPVVTVQHLLGLATGILIYLLLLRWGVWRWMAALATVPVLWDSYELVSEHTVLPDTLFVFVVAAALLVLCWRSPSSLSRALVSGVMLGVASTVRPMGGPLVVVAVIFMLLAGASWRSRFAGALVVIIGVSAVVVPYVAWYHHLHGQYATAQSRPDGGLGTAASPSHPQRHDRLHALAPLLDWSPADPRADDDIGTWRFTSHVSPQASPAAGLVYARHGGDQPQVYQPGADALVGYQDHGYTPGPLLLGALLLALIAGVGAGRAGPSGMRPVCLLTALVPGGILLGAASAADLSWRNQIPALVLWPAAGALGLTALLRGRRSSAAGRSQVDDADRAAEADFHERYGDPALAPVAVVIAAYNEADGLPGMLADLPSTVRGLAADVIIVDDGSTDDTATAATAHARAYLVSSPVNRGQGAAMRLGYRIARDHGARYILTTDADGQYDTADFPTVLGPVLDGSADFVTGSRRLGHQHTQDRFRRAGVYVFAWVVNALTGERLTDTSFGLRAMRAEVTATVTLNQPQYQSAELLIGAHSHGYRIVEVPGTMHVRSAGSTKKGGNVVYGLRYARVVLGTWWREGCPAPAGERAPALLGRGEVSHASVGPGR